MQRHTVIKPLLFSLSLAVSSYATAATECDGVALTPCPAPFDHQLPDPHQMLNWSQKDRVVGFRNDYRNYAGDVFLHGQAKPLAHANNLLVDAQYQVNGHTYHLADYLKRENVAGMLVLKNGKVAYKYFAEGNTDTTLWTSRSVGKSVVSTLVGIAIKQGKIHSLNDNITAYEPELKGTAWDGVTLKQLIQHTSGVAWNEDYTNPKSDFAQLTQCEAQAGAYACVRHIVTHLKRAHPAGEQWSYSSGGAWLLGMCWNVQQACHWRLTCSKPYGNPMAWPVMASGMLTNQESMTWVLMVSTPRWKIGVALVNLSSTRVACPMVSKSCPTIG